MTCQLCGGRVRDAYRIPRLRRLTAAREPFDPLAHVPESDLYRVFCSEDCADAWRDLRIWWLLPEEMRWIGEPHERADFDREPAAGARICWLEDKPWPEYLKREYRSAYGRPGRGRLWVPPPFKLTAIPWNEDSPVEAVCGASAGIVFRSRDLPRLANEPGTITDLEMEPLS